MSNGPLKLQDISKKVYKDQAIWFLNGFFHEFKSDEEREQMWIYVKKFVELDLLSDEKKGEKGNELDKFWSAKFLEDMDKAITFKERKEALQSIDHDNNGKMSLIEYLLWKKKKTVEEVENAAQGDNQEEIERCQAEIAKVQAAMEALQIKLDAQKAAFAEAKAAADKMRDAEAELQAAVDEFKAQEAAYLGKIKELEAIVADPSTSGMKKAKASNECAQLKAEDPLPLRRAKITQEAAVRKVQKLKKPLEEKEAKLAAIVAELETSYDELKQQFIAAEESLKKAKQAGGTAWGAIWFMQRELYEQDSRLATARQRYDHSKGFQFSKED